MFGSLCKGVTAIVTWAALITAANAQTPGQDPVAPFMRVFGHALPPIGHVDFCRRHGGDCRPAPSRSNRVVLDAQRWEELQEVNDLVNRSIAPVTDLDLYGRLEHWAYPRTAGDCEDYVLLKRKLLIDGGWPQGALLITVVRDELGEGHAVLTVRTTSGDVILDNKRPDILTWNASTYSFVKRQSYSDPTVWMSLAAPEAPSDAQVATNRRP